MSSLLRNCTSDEPLTTKNEGNNLKIYRSLSAFSACDGAIFFSGKFVSDKYIFVSSRNRAGMLLEDLGVRPRSSTTSSLPEKRHRQIAVYKDPAEEEARLATLKNFHAFSKRPLVARSSRATSAATCHGGHCAPSASVDTGSIINEKDISMTGKYLLREALASGSFGEVKLGQSKRTNEEVAVKVIPKYILRSNEEQESVRREIEIHSKLHHPNVIKLIETFEDERAHYLVLERATCGDLDALLHLPNGINEVGCCDIFHHIMLGIEYIHRVGVVHLDIKPHNILICSKNVVKICDLGGARFCDGFVDVLPFTVVTGTCGYIAPEILMHRHHGHSADIWSAGVLLYEMLFDFQPFYPPSSCINEDVVFPPCTARRQVSDSAKDLVRKMLAKEPAERPTATECLQHPWFSSVLQVHNR